MVAFGEKLKRIRKERSLTQEEAAGKMGVSGQAVSKWEKGECLPDVYNLKMLTRLYRVSADSLLETETGTVSSNVQAGRHGEDFLLGELPFFVGYSDAEPSFGRWFATHLAGGYFGTPMNPAPGEIAKIVESVEDAMAKSSPGGTSIVFGSYDGCINKGQMQLAAALFALAKQKGISFAAVALRNPSDILLLPHGAYGLALPDYSEKSFEAVATVLRRAETGKAGLLG